MVSAFPGFNLIFYPLIPIILMDKSGRLNETLLFI